MDYGGAGPTCTSSQVGPGEDFSGTITVMKRVIVAVIRHPETGKFLLVSSAKDYGEFTGYFYPPGGTIEPGEAEEDTICREILEELNLVIEPVRKIAQTPGDVADQETSWWEGRVLSGEMRPSNEIAQAGYYSREEMSAMPIWPATEAFFREYIDAPRIVGERE
jgi:8-oxo-dGTP pyrophosphatase MutT (NUDIX family)